MTVPVYQLVLLWEAVFGFSEFFFFEDTFKAFAHLMKGDLQGHLPIPHWVFSSFCPKMAWPLCPTLPSHLISLPSDFFCCCFPRWKKSSKGNVLLMWKRWNKKPAEALKGSKIDKLNNYFEQWKKVLFGVLLQMKSTLKVMFKHGRINTQFSINKVLVFWGPLSYICTSASKPKGHHFFDLFHRPASLCITRSCTFLILKSLC